MSIELYGGLKSSLLYGGFQGQTIYISVPKPQGTSGGTALENVLVTFKTDTIDTIRVYESMQFAIKAGTLLDKVYISNVPLTVESANGVNVDIIELETENADGEDETKLYETNGIYLLNGLSIKITEGE